MDKLLFEAETKAMLASRAMSPRSIDERERRTKISEKLRNLQKLVPNMEKLTSTADMLDLAAQHIKHLQTQLQVGNMRSFEETFLVGYSVIYGRADDKNRIIEVLSSEDGDNANSTVVSIVAERGTGRTTMLHHLQSDFCNVFDTRKFICMPEQFDEKGLMRVIIESLTGIPCDITDLEILKETVKEELMNQSILLLLDNFENKSQKCWDLLSTLLKVCKKKSAVVVTATRKAVGEVQGPIRFYYMNNLSNEWCWKIFKQYAFTGQNTNANTELADIGNRLVARCRNVALCIKVLSGLLRHSITEDWWKAVCDNKFWEMDEGDIPSALRVCYEFLPSHLKQCFKYCSLFPKEYIFSKQHLVRMWLSQGFIEPAEAREIEDIGIEYFDQLLSRSFFEPSLIHDVREDKFVMPGLIHDLAQQLSKNECFQFEGCVQRAPENACHLSLVPHEFQSVSLNHLIPSAQNLQTLLVVSRSAFQHQSISTSILNLVELDDLFVKSHSLITLDLSNTDIEELPESFWAINNLRYLSLSSTKIKRIPSKISNLVHLQTLEAKDCHYLEELPRTMDALTNLRYLDVTKEAGYVVMPRGMGKLTNLRSLATFNIGMDPLLHCGIEELKDMEHLKGSLEISGLVNVSSRIDAKGAHMKSKEHIGTLFLSWSDGETFLEGEEGAEIAEEVLECLHPTDNLKEMIIRDYPGKIFPIWIECAPFSRLASIIFDHCYNCERLPDLGGLPLLKLLSIQKMYCVQRMNLSGSEYTPENSIRYPSLEKLTIWEMYELVEWVEIGNGDFPALRYLCINKCPLLRNIPKFPALVELSVYSSAQFLEDMDLPSLHSLRIEGLQRTKSVRLPKNLVGLKKLEISHCLEPLSIEGLSLLNSLETINVVRCPQLVYQDVLEMENLKRGVQTCDGKELVFNEQLDFSGFALDFSSSDLSDKDEGQKHPIISKKRKGREELSSLSGVSSGVSFEEHKKIKELQSQMSKQDQTSKQGQTSEEGQTSKAKQVRNVPRDRSSSRHRRTISPRRETQVSDLSSVLGDGDTWRKYGQKDTLGCKYPRSYYRCDHQNSQGCEAKMQIQRNEEDPSVFDIVYAGTHTCRYARGNVSPSSSSLVARSETTVSGTHTFRNERGNVSPSSSSLVARSETTVSGTHTFRYECGNVSPSSSSLAARSETMVSDITALHSVDSDLSVPQFESDQAV